MVGVKKLQRKKTQQNNLRAARSVCNYKHGSLKTNAYVAIKIINQIANLKLKQSSEEIKLHYPEFCEENFHVTIETGTAPISSAVRI